MEDGLFFKVYQFFKDKIFKKLLPSILGLHNQIDNLYRIKFPDTSDKFMIFATIPRHVVLPEFVISQVIYSKFYNKLVNIKVVLVSIAKY